MSEQHEQPRTPRQDEGELSDDALESVSGGCTIHSELNDPITTRVIKFPGPIYPGPTIPIDPAPKLQLD